MAGEDKPIVKLIVELDLSGVSRGIYSLSQIRTIYIDYYPKPPTYSVAEPVPYKVIRVVRKYEEL